MVKNETISNDYGNVAINRTILKEVYARNCTCLNDKCDINSNATVTDLNIWDRALSYNELERWTTCR